MSEMTYEGIRRSLRRVIIQDIESHEVGGERLAFNREVGRKWFHDNEGQAVFVHLKATLEDSLRALKHEGLSEERLRIHAASLRLDLLAKMHGSDDPAAIFKEEFSLSSWYRSMKHIVDPAGELSDREFADMNTHLLLQEACYMLELPGFLEVTSTSGAARSVEGRLAAVEATNRRFRIVGVVALAGIVVLVGVAFGTARHWTKVDVAEHPTTFRREVYTTGDFIVEDDHRSPCTVGQDWSVCIDEMTNQYDSGCTYGGTGRFANSELWQWSSGSTEARHVCQGYKAEIERMKEASWGYVATLGNFGHLTKTPKSAIRKVSNKDYRRAVTHDAVCYLQFIGECR